MKHNLLLFIFFCSAFCKGQEYTPLLNEYSNTWSVASCFNGCIQDFYYTNGDTLVDNLSYKILDGYHYINRNFLIREEVAEKKVYLTTILPNRIDTYLLYDFSLEEGDTFEMKNPISPFPTDGGLYVLDSIRWKPLELDPIFRKHFYFSPHSTNTSSNENPVWVEGAGSLSIINAPGGTPNLMGVGELVCALKNSELFYYKIYPEFGIGCYVLNNQAFYNEGIKWQLGDDKIFKIQSPDRIIQIEIVSLLGTKIYHKKNALENNIEIDVGNFMAGVYFVKLYFQDSIKIIKTKF